MPLKPEFNFSEGVLQKLAQYATDEIEREDVINWLYDNGAENPEQFLKEREHLISVIRAVIERYKNDAPETGSMAA
jgi:hypothetical protein